MLPGIFTSNSGINGERVDSFANRIYKFGYAGTAPMLALSSGMARNQLKAKIVHWFEEEEYSGHVDVINNAGTGTTLVLKSGTVLPKSILFVESTGERMLVTATAGTSLTVQRGFAGTSITAINGSTTPVGAYVIGSAFEEASDAPQPMLTVGAPMLNYSQIFRDSWANSRSAEKINWHTGDKVAKNKQDAIANHAKGIERALMFGAKSMFTVDGQQDSTMDGLVNMIKTNVQTVANGELDLNTLIDFIATLFEYNVDGMPQERVAFCGNNVISVINKLILNRNEIRLTVGQTDYGLKTNVIRTAFGDLTLLTHPMFNASPVWRNNLLVYHPGACCLDYMDDAIISDSTPPGMDGSKYTITSELTMEYTCEKTAGILSNIVAPKE